MAQIKPSLAKGTRDFSPLVMEKRNFIFNTLRFIFKKYGYNEIQTPSFENLSTLTGKYGEEGDKLIFKILNSGDFLSKASSELMAQRDSQGVIAQISEKALRYDLTVPFARYVAMHQSELVFPFKRFQIQPVWRADRPQRGRYREFYQCDVDVVGSESLLNEAEFILIYFEALKTMGLNAFTIRLNNRKIWTGLAEVLGKPQQTLDMTVAIDKLDKIGIEGVNNELISKGFTSRDLDILQPLITLSGDSSCKLAFLKELSASSEIGLKGVSELEDVLSYVKNFCSGEDVLAHVEVDVTLARGLNYYTGCIFEVMTNAVKMGSIGGGGRYDDLTSMFGLKGVCGVGVSFGADRIYDVLEELGLFPDRSKASTKLLIVNFGKSCEAVALPIMHELRSHGIAVELYPEIAKIKKQMAYANSKHIPYVLLIGEDELEKGVVTLKDMIKGDQNMVNKDELRLLLQD